MLAPLEILVASDERDVATAIEAMSGWEQDYGKSYPEWLHGKFANRLENQSETNPLLLARYEGRVIGDVAMRFGEDVWPDVKHFRVANGYETHGLGKFLWRYAEVMAAEHLGLAPGETGVLELDTRERNRAAVNFFTKMGCTVIDCAALYEDSIPDLVMQKRFTAPKLLAA